MGRSSRRFDSFERGIALSQPASSRLWERIEFDPKVTALRQSAEERLSERAPIRVADDDLEHELRVRQAELEIQNEELRDVEQSLEASRREFFALFDLAPVGYVTVDSRGCIRRANLTASEMLGCDRVRLPGRPLSSYLDEGQARAFFDHLARVLGTKQSVSCELAFRAQGGRTFQARVTSALAPPSLSDGAELFLTLVDISDRVRATEALEEREGRLRAIVDHAPLAIALVDHQSQLIECNEVFERLVEQRSPELLGSSLLDLVHRADRSPLRSLLRAQGRSAQSEFRIGRRASEVRAWVTPVDGGKRGEPRRLLLMEDLSERKRADERASFLEDELVTAHQEKLHVLGQLAGGVAHDFNNMLAAIMAFAESGLLSDELSEDIREDLGGIRAASLRARDLVREVLTFARRRHPVRGRADLQAVLRSSLALVKGAAPSHVRFDSVGVATAPVLIDEGQVEQALVNVLTNAVQAFGQRSGTIHVELGSETLKGVSQSDGQPLEAGPYWRLSIRDDGPGIESDVLARIFEPYFTTRERSGGCGMGLATCQSVVEIHGGIIEVASEPGLGAEFRLFFPQYQEQVVEKVIPQPPPRRFDGRALVVDDEGLVLRACRRVLSGLGLTVETLESPVEAATLIAEHPGRFDVVISDLSMPEMSGVRLASQVNQAAPSLPVLILTGNRARIDPEELAVADIAGIIEKPLSIREISEALSLIGIKEAAPAAP